MTKTGLNISNNWKKKTTIVLLLGFLLSPFVLPAQTAMKHKSCRMEMKNAQMSTENSFSSNTFHSQTHSCAQKEAKNEKSGCDANTMLKHCKNMNLKSGIIYAPVNNFQTDFYSMIVTNINRINFTETREFNIPFLHKPQGVLPLYITGNSLLL